MSGVILKAGETARLSRGMYSLDLRDIAERAESMLEAARGQAAKIVDAARVRAESDGRSLREAARREGYEQGFAAGRQAGLQTALVEAREMFSKEHESLASALTKLVSDFDRQRDSLYAEARRDVVVLAIAIAARLSKAFAAMEDIAPAAAVGACEEALALLGGATDVVIRTHPQDAAAIEHLADTLSASLKSSRHLRIVEDESVERGGVDVAAANCTVDAKIRERVERIADELVTDWRRRMKELSLES
ncbi:MAG: FliH/SctL family protein [Phycisphaerae bacterium]